MKKYNVKTCIYGHLHGESGKDAKQGEIDGIDFKLVSCDQVEFKLQKYINKEMYEKSHTFLYFRLQQ